MSHFSKQLQKQVLPGFNKADSASAQLLLHSAFLLKLSGFFINLIGSKSIESRFIAVFQLFIRPTNLTTCLSHVSVFVNGFSNKTKAYFLMLKSLALARSSSYFTAALTL